MINDPVLSYLYMEVRKMKETRKKAFALTVRLNGLGIVGFNNHFLFLRNNKIIPVNRAEQPAKNVG